MSILRDLFPDIAMHGEKSIPTKYGTKRKVDIGLNTPVEADYVVIELKNEKDAIGVGALDQLLGTTRAINAKKGALIINHRPTRDLVKAAEHEAIPIFQTIDPGDDKVRNKLTIKTVTEFVWVSEYSYKGEFIAQEIELNYPPEKLILNDDKTTLHEKVCELWNSGTLDVSPGRHVYVIDEFNLVKSPEFGLIAMPIDSMKIEYGVVSKKYIYDAPLSKGSGLYEPKTKIFTFSSNEIGIGPLCIDLIARPENETTKSVADLNAVFNGYAKFVMGSETGAER